jgi:hypothetical protein
MAYQVGEIRLGQGSGKMFEVMEVFPEGGCTVRYCGQPEKASWEASECQERHAVVAYITHATPTPIPEPAPELCALSQCTASRPGYARGTRAEHDRSLPGKAQCHPFVAPQAKPVLRGPMPLADGLPDVCLKCRGGRGGNCLYFCWTCFDATPMADLLDVLHAWDALHRKPAAKDIPSATGGDHRGAWREDTEAARGGEATVTKPAKSPVPNCPRPLWQRIKSESRERGPSAVAAAPAIEPWRPTVDDFDLLPDAHEGWRR